MSFGRGIGVVSLSAVSLLSGFISTANAEPPKKFSLLGAIKINPSAFVLASSNSIDSLQFSFFPETVEAAPRDVFSLIISDRYSIELDMAYASQKTLFRVSGGMGIVSAEDYIINNGMILQTVSDGGSVFTITDISIQTLDDRYFIESNFAESLIGSQMYPEFYKLMRMTETLLDRSRPDLLYGLIQQYTRGLTKALKENAPTFGDDVARIYRYESSPAFGSLSDVQRAQIYSGYARALLSSQFVPTAMFNGKKLWEIVDHCYASAIANGIPDSTAAYSERIASLLSAKEADTLAATVVDEFLATINAKGRQATPSERAAVISALLSLIVVIDRIGDENIDLFEPDEYVLYAQSDVQVADLWQRFHSSAKQWDFLFPVNSKTDTGKSLRRYYEMSIKVVSNQVVGG